jgi:uncharacterized membrane protein
MLKTTSKLLLATLVLFTMLSSVAASPAELTIFPQESSTEINSFTSYTVEVQNVGPVADRYFISSSSPEQITYAPQTVPETGVLEPGESDQVQVWYNPTSRMDAGTYSFSITAKSEASGDRYSADARANVIKDHEVALDLDTSKTACLGEETRYTIDVTNEGIQEETFQLTARYDNAEFSEDKVTLQPDETREITMTVSADTEVQENFNVIASSSSSYAQEIVNVNFETETCFASEVEISPQNQEVAAGEEAQYQVTVRNTGTQNDTFTVSANRGELSDTTVEVEGNSAQTVNLTVTPQELGNKTVEISVEGRSNATKTAQMTVYNGMDVSTEFTQENYKVCETGQFTLQTQVTNTGEAEETYTLSAPEGTKLGQEEVTLEPNQTATINLTDNSTDLEIGSYNYEVAATASTFGEPTKTAQTTVKVEDCYGVSLNVVPNVASAGENKSVIYQININNTGTKQNTYKLTHEGPEWVSIRPEEVTVQPGKKGKAYMYAGIPFGKDQGEVQITARAEGTQVADTEDVKLLIGKEIKEAIKDDSNNGPTGGFASDLPLERVGLGSDLGKIVASLLIGLLITAAVLYREW